MNSLNHKNTNLSCGSIFLLGKEQCRWSLMKMFRFWKKKLKIRLTLLIKSKKSGKEYKIVIALCTANNGLTSFPICHSLLPQYFLISESSENYVTMIFLRPWIISKPDMLLKIFLKKAWCLFKLKIWMHTSWLSWLCILKMVTWPRR